MLPTPTPDYVRETCEQTRKWSAMPWIIDGVLVYVDDLDAHFARAKAAGATILSEIQEDSPGRRYRAEDLEGHRWFFIGRNKSGSSCVRVWSTSSTVRDSHSHRGEVAGLPRISGWLTRRLQPTGAAPRR